MRTQRGIITLAFDEGPGVGLGHRRRMEALAQELEARGFRCPMVSLADSSMIAGRVAVIDSYLMRADDPGRVSAGLVVAIDDLRRDLAVDVVVDPSPGADLVAHASAARALAGAAYALVSVPPVNAVAVDGPVERVLVTTGAADAEGVGARLAERVALAVPGSETRLVIGPWGAIDVPPGVVAVHTRGGLACEIAAAPIVVTAGGVALLESCVLGRATAAVVLSANQRQAVEGLASAGAVVAATPDNVGETVQRLAADPEWRLRLATNARDALDGKGPVRVADAIEELV